MDSHSPNMTLLSHQQGQDPMTWTIIEADDKDLILKGISNSNRDIQLNYLRRDAFPSF